MNTLISVHYLSDLKSTLGKTVILIGLDKSSLVRDVEELCKGGDSTQLRNVLSANQALVLATMDKLKEGKDSAGSVELHLLDSKGNGDLYRIVLCVLPKAASRHNTPSRSHAVSSLVKQYCGGGGSSITIILHGYASSLPPAEKKDIVFAQAIACGRGFPMFSMKTSGGNDASSASQQTVDIFLDISLPNENDVATAYLSSISHTIAGIRSAQRIVDMPPNLLHTDSMVEECVAVSKRLSNVEITIIRGTELRDGGFGGLWGVGKASDRPPALVCLSYVPPGCTKDAAGVALVGKTIVYDTGGLSIKVPPGMAGMKNDMGGGAACLYSFETAVQSGISVPLHAILCIAENSVGPASTRPDDIITLLSGLTIEVNNTDAEGRLVLSDGVFYAATRLNVKTIIDAATLTGAQLIATGKNHAALYCSHEELETLAIKVGRETGDLCHPLPYAPEFYRKEFVSPVADFKNSVADRMNAQSSCAGQFIGNSLESYLEVEGNRWLHVDMAGPVDLAGRATGFGVALLSQLALRLANERR